MRPELLGPNQLLRPADSILVKRGMVTVQECAPCQPCLQVPTMRSCLSSETPWDPWACLESKQACMPTYHALLFRIRSPQVLLGGLQECMGQGDGIQSLTVHKHSPEAFLNTPTAGCTTARCARPGSRRSPPRAWTTMRR